MTLRDYFAARAMQGLLAGDYQPTQEDDLAVVAYRIADSLVRVRAGATETPRGQSRTEWECGADVDPRD